ncbi:MAG: hypothetical protein ACRDDX_07340 [Cellulosilyticaceae bacterium]
MQYAVGNKTKNIVFTPDDDYDDFLEKQVISLQKKHFQKKGYLEEDFHSSKKKDSPKNLKKRA